MTRAEVAERLGDPGGIDCQSNESGDEDWRYTRLSLSLSFADEDDLRLGAITFSSPRYLLAGHSLVGRSIAELKMEVSLQKLPPLSIDEHVDFLGATNFEIETFGCTVWARDFIVQNFTIYPRYDDSGETPIWPE
ncbi:MAG: hypothetical protein AAFP04_09795 [Myxococcota bacterium]